MKTLFFLLFAITSLHAELFNHLTKIEKSKTSKGIRGVDFVYMINLDARQEKWKDSLKELQPYGILPYRFSAVVGKDLPLSTLDAVGLKYRRGMRKDVYGEHYSSEGVSTQKTEIPGRTYFSTNMGQGAVIGCALSHISILKDAYDSGFETVWIMEDDVKVIKNPHTISNYIDELDSLVGKKGWDILFTDLDTKDSNGNYVSCHLAAKRPDIKHSNRAKFKLNKTISPHLRQVGARYGAYSMVIRRSGLKKLLDFYKKHQIFLPYDLDYVLPKNIKLFTPLEDIVSFRLDAPSDNR